LGERKVIYRYRLGTPGTKIGKDQPFKDVCVQAVGAWLQFWFSVLAKKRIRNL
jgi:hypothetical protein